MTTSKIIVVNSDLIKFIKNVKSYKFGKKHTWVRRVDSIDASKTGVHAYVGEYVQAGVELRVEPDQCYLVVEPAGRYEKYSSTAHLVYISEDGSPVVSDRSWSWETEALSGLEYAQQFLAGEVE